MRIHTDYLTANDIHTAAWRAGVDVLRMTPHGSRSRTRAFEVALTGSSSRRTMDGSAQAATWDEWGAFIGHLYRVDEGIIAGQYKDWNNFHFQTNFRFGRDFKPVPGHSHKWEYSGGWLNCECGASVDRSAGIA